MDAVTSPTQATASTASTGALASQTSDFETFLTLLTAQIRNQDPLAPMDNTEFVAQLASFSAVEQQVSTNETLNAMLSAMTATQSEDYMSWIGRSAAVEGPATFDGQPIDVRFDSSAPDATLVVRDINGSVVDRVVLPNPATSAAWTPAAHLQSLGATFHFEREVKGQENSTEITKGATFRAISEVHLSAQGSELITNDGEVIAPEDVIALR